LSKALCIEVTEVISVKSLWTLGSSLLFATVF